MNQSFRIDSTRKSLNFSITHYDFLANTSVSFAIVSQITSEDSQIAIEESLRVDDFAANDFAANDSIMFVIAAVTSSIASAHL